MVRRKVTGTDREGRGIKEESRMISRQDKWITKQRIVKKKKISWWGSSRGDEQ